MLNENTLNEVYKNIIVESEDEYFTKDELLMLDEYFANNNFTNNFLQSNNYLDGTSEKMSHIIYYSNENLDNKVGGTISIHIQKWNSTNKGVYYSVRWSLTSEKRVDNLEDIIKFVDKK